MALITLPGNQDAVEVIPAAGKGVVQCQSGTAVIENAVDPINGIIIKQGEALALDGWTAAWNAKSAIPGRAVVLRVAVE